MVNPERTVEVIWQAWSAMTDVARLVPFDDIENYDFAIEELEDLYKEITGLDICTWRHRKEEWI